MLDADNLVLFSRKGNYRGRSAGIMRCRTHDSFVIIDEAQNTTSAMEMFLTRLGFNSKEAVIKPGM